MKEFHSERDQYLEEKFNELDAEGKGYLNKQETFEMFKQIHALDQSMKPGRDQEFTIQHFDRMFYMLNTVEEKTQNNINASTITPTRSGQIQGKVSKVDFMKIFEVYELWKYESQFSQFYQA